MNAREVGWWHTIPGIVTAMAGIVTAITGLVVALHQIGLFGNDRLMEPQEIRELRELVRELKENRDSGKAQVTKAVLNLKRLPRDSSEAMELVALLEKMNRQAIPPNPGVEAVLRAPTLSADQKATLAMEIMMQAIDRDINSAARSIEGMPKSRAAVEETLQVKRLIERRSQMFDQLRQISDQYNQSAKRIIDLMGR